MSRRYRSRASNINAAVWLIGIGILWLTDLWWPGILILVGISMLVQVMVPRASAPPPAPVKPQHAAEEVVNEAVSEEKDPWEEEEEAETPAFMQPEAQTAGDHARLPAQCPSCGGPVAENAHKVAWSGPNSATCPFCDTPLTLSS